MSNYGENIVFLNGLTAGTAISQYMVVKRSSTTDLAVLPTTATTDVAIGICQNDPATGEAALVAALGEVIALAGTSNLAVGEIVGFNSTGVIDTTTDNQRVIGQAMEASTAKSDEVRVLLSGLKRY